MVRRYPVHSGSQLTMVCVPAELNFAAGLGVRTRGHCKCSLAFLYRWLQNNVPFCSVDRETEDGGSLRFCYTPFGQGYGACSAWLASFERGA